MNVGAAVQAFGNTGTTDSIAKYSKSWMCVMTLVDVRKHGPKVESNDSL